MAVRKDIDPLKTVPLIAISQSGVVQQAFAELPGQNIENFRTLRLAPWALEPFLAGVLGAPAAIRKLPYTRRP